MWWNGNLLKFLPNYSTLLTSELHAQDAEVGSSKVQSIEQSLLIPVKVIF